MKTTLLKSLLVTCYFVYASSPAFCSSETLVNFQELDLGEAGQAGKKIMVSFTADWCLPCKMMKSSLYNDPEIASLVNTNFQPVLVDVESSLGESWNEDYNIDYLPSVLFTDPSGIEYERIKKLPSRQEFLNTLNRIIKTKAVPYRAHNHNKPSASKRPEPVSSVTNKSPTITSNYAIQLGAYSTYDSAAKRVQSLNGYREDNYVIIQEETKGKILYKVVSYQLSLEETRETLRLYQNKGIDSFARRN